MLLQEHKGETDAWIEQPSSTTEERINSLGESLLQSLAPVAGPVVEQQSPFKMALPSHITPCECWNPVGFD